MHKLAEPVDGEISTAKAAAETKTLMCLRYAFIVSY